MRAHRKSSVLKALPGDPLEERVRATAACFRQLPQGATSALLRVSEEPLALVDLLDLRVVEANAAANAAFELPEGQLAQMDTLALTELVGALDRPSIRTALADTVLAEDGDVVHAQLSERCVRLAMSVVGRGVDGAPSLGLVAGDTTPSIDRVLKRHGVSATLFEHGRSDPRPAWLETVDGANRREVEMALKTALTGLSEHLDCEYDMHDENGHRRMRTRGRVIEDRHGRRLAGHHLDVTEQARREEGLRASEARFRALVAGSPDAIAVHRAGRFVYVNKRMSDLLGAEQCDDLVGALVLERVADEHVDGIADRVRRLALGEIAEAPAIEVALLRLDGEATEVELVSIALSWDQAPAIFTVARDVTERKRLQAQLAQADRMATLGTVAAGVAHEINNPLSFVSLSLDGLREDLPGLRRQLDELHAHLADRLGADEADDVTRGLREALSEERTDQRLEEAHYGFERIREIVRDLSAFARVDDEVNPVPVDRVIEMAVKLANHETRHRAEVVTRVLGRPWVKAAEGRLVQVVLNLLVNAAHAMEGRDGHIRVHLRQLASEAVLEIEDDGHGIPAEVQARLFDPFFTTKAAGKGSGLGLAICRHHIEAAGGTIDVESSPEVGSRFRIRLPTCTPAGAAMDDTTVEETETGVLGRVLIIDDEPLMLKLMKRGLQKRWDVELAESGEEALAVLEHEHYDVILCDLMMRGVDGRAVHAWVRRHRPELLDRLVFVTAGGVTSESRHFLEQVDNLVVPKPIDLKNLQRLMKKLVPSNDPDAWLARASTAK